MSRRLVAAAVSIASQGTRVVVAASIKRAHTATAVAEQQGLRAKLRPRHVGQPTSKTVRAWVDAHLGAAARWQPTSVATRLPLSVTCRAPPLF